MCSSFFLTHLPRKPGHVMSKITGAEAIIKCLQEEGVDLIFGYPGGAVIELYDELLKSPIRHILVRHEQGAVHAADGYARASGKVGVALLTSGPGATNGVTAIATAYSDSIPVVVLTGQVPRALIGNDAFQEVDIVGITRPCTKHNYLVNDPKDLVPTLREAFYLAAAGRPGPVLVDLPKDIIAATIDYPEKKPVKMPTYQPNTTPHPRQVERACRAILQAKRPVLYVGGGVILSNSNEEVTWLARRLSIPVTMTLMGLGGFPGTDPLSLGMLGMHGTYAANMAVAKSDLLIAVGSRFDDRVTGRLDAFAPEAKIIHIDIDPSSISKNVSVDIPIVADCKLALAAINNWFNNLQDFSESAMHEQLGPWLAQVREWQQAYPLGYIDDEEVIKPQYVIEKLQELTNGQAIITTEVGQNQMWAAQFYRFDHPRRLLTSGGLGTMGYGLPAAIGAQLAFPEATVIDIAGDGSIQMNIQELATAKESGAPVKVAILNNSFLGMVRQWQELFYKRHYAATTMDFSPDFVTLASAYQAVGLRAKTKAEVVPVIKEALATDNVVIMDFVISREERVFPMVPAGKATTEMLLV
ncbi:MAG: biosynthetic-type acetolactate synthase large subunit [Desulfobulbaceae bacterium]|nr:biosynthetic-type acetolactate synthase large subunit [Desulfobulbaceae bacterium]